MTDDQQPYFVRGSDGILTHNPKASRWNTAGYYDPDEAVNVSQGNQTRLGCTHKIFSNYSSYPCNKVPKHDPDKNGRPTKCGIHSAASFQKRQDKAEAKRQAWRDAARKRADIQAIRNEMLPLIQSIADGHNDPRGACAEWLDRYNAAKGND